MNFISKLYIQKKMKKGEVPVDMNFKISFKEMNENGQAQNSYSADDYKKIIYNLNGPRLFKNVSLAKYLTKNNDSYIDQFKPLLGVKPDSNSIGNKTTTYWTKDTQVWQDLKTKQQAAPAFQEMT